MFKKALIFGFLFLPAACRYEFVTTTATSTGATGGEGGTGGTSSSTGAGGGTTASSGGGGSGGTTTTTPTVDQCQQKACADLECGFTFADCNGDGINYHIDCGGCAAPEACTGSNEPHKCGDRCLSKPEYTGACGEGVEFACNDAAPGCGFCYKYGLDGVPVYKVVGVDCPVVTAPDGTKVRCCVPGCGGDC